MIAPLVSVVMPAYRVNEMTCNSLFLLKNKTAYPNFEVIVMSTPGSFAENVNRGIQAERSRPQHENSPIAKYICLFNDDLAVVQPEWLSRLVEVMESDTTGRIAGVSPRMLFPNGMCQFGGMVFHGDEKRRFEAGHYGWGRKQDDPRILQPREFQATTFGCVLLRREAIEDVGLLDEGYMIGGFEDVDWCLQARLKGWRFGYVPQSVIIHAESATFNSMDQGKRAESFARNRARYHEKWDSAWKEGKFEIDDVKYDGGMQ